jgi:hypothetical protein
MNGGIDGRAAARGGVLCRRQNRKQRSRVEEQRAEGVQRKKKRGKDPKDWFGNFRKFKGLLVN